MTTDKELQYQARIRELVEALRDSNNYILHVGSSAVMRGNPHPQQLMVDKNESALSRPDDLSALDAHVIEEKRKVLDQLMKKFTVSDWNADAKFFAETVCRIIAETSKELK